MLLSNTDWMIIVVFLLFLLGMAIYSRRYNRGVADFLAANRCAGRYLICIAYGMAALGAVSIVSQFQTRYEAGFAGSWWYTLRGPIMSILVATGWIIYRFRETRSLTLAQFFEARYGRKFRIFSGIVAFIAGITNYGIFPAIGATFFINYCGLPDKIGIFSTFHLMMFFLLAFSVYFTFSGGQISVILTDFLQGMFTNFVFIAIFIFVLKDFGIGTILDGLEYAPAGKSMLNPVDIQGNKGFNLWYFLIQTIFAIYGFKAWQAQQGYNCSARSPHEAKMAGILGSYRSWAFMGAVTIVPLCAYTIMHHPDYADKALQVESALSGIENAEVRSQMTAPVALTTFIPSGLMGCFAAAMIAAFISTHNTQLHSWGSIFIQDVVMPFRNKPLRPKTHMRLLKFSIIMVAVLVFVFSSVFRQTQHFQIYAMVSGAVYIGGAGIVIIGGLYWKKGSSAGAWAAMISSACISLTALGLEQYWVRFYEKSFPVNFKWWTVISIFGSVFLYVIISLIQKKDFNLDKMLHRGQYALEKDKKIKSEFRKKKWYERFGVTDDFTRFDKFLWGFTIGQSFFFFFYVIIVTVIYLTIGFPEKYWRYVQAVKIWWMVILFAPISIFLTIGGFRDMFSFFRDLNLVKQNILDDGTVVDGHNLADEVENPNIKNNEQ